ncbi:biotin--[acetyl-CoA-carboxylase] ligase [Microbacterium sp.]|uniref:biotin--[acetyl-CoA-carboxylase] ligase n=1 Tax=Microbacterium sp. TaxID=51671 RepID=UPI0033411D7D
MEFPRASRIASRLDVAAQSPSTNAELRARAQDVVAWPHLSVLLTADQTAGRGRLDRGWVTPPGAALAISVVLRDLPGDPALRGWLPLIAGAAMAEAVGDQLPGRDVGVKWPNDVLVEGRKICGILAEATTDAVIVGSGVNTAMTAEQLPVATATSFAVEGVDVDADRLVADYLGGLDALLTRLRAGADVRTAVIARCITLGQQVTVSLPGGDALRGEAVDLDEDGRLVVAVDGVRRAVSAGDVVHVRPV